MTMNNSNPKSRAFSPIALLVLAACVASAALLVACVRPGSAAAASTSNQKLTAYAVLSRVLFLNNADDRRRAIINNPFTTNTAKLMTVMKGKEKQTGPLPGDTALFTFTLYKDAGLKQQSGDAVYTCDYDFSDKGFCQAYYELKGGTVLVSGPIAFKTFNSGSFALVVRGGTNAYLGARGGLSVSLDGKLNARRLSFDLIGITPA